MAGKKQQLRSSRIYKDGKFYDPKKPGIVVALAPYGLMNNRYTVSDNEESKVYINDLK
jgi:hypothetical protein